MITITENKVDGLVVEATLDLECDKCKEKVTVTEEGKFVEEKFRGPGCTGTYHKWLAPEFPFKNKSKHVCEKCKEESSPLGG